MVIKDLEYHKEELHKVTGDVKQLRKSLGIAKRSSDDEILYRLLKNYKYWVNRVKKGRNINREKYVRKRIMIFYKLALSKAFHQSIIVMRLKNGKKEGC